MAWHVLIIKSRKREKENTNICLKEDKKMTFDILFVAVISLVFVPFVVVAMAAPAFGKK